MSRAQLFAVAFVGLAASAPNNQGCVSEVARKLPYCNTSLSTDARLDDLLSRLTLKEKIAQITHQRDLGDSCGAVTKGKAEIGLPPWLWVVETNTNVASGCPKEGRCTTTFVGPLGVAASFNRTSWRLKGSVLATEMRAFSNIGASRFRPGGHRPIGLTAFGPNINIVRDPRNGRNSELPGEDPMLSGAYAFQVVSALQEKDAHGYFKTAAFLKHYTAYSRETNRMHDSHNISKYDLEDTYLPQYRLAFQAEPHGVMCSYTTVNGAPACASDWLLNKQLRSWKPDAMVLTDCMAVQNMMGAPVHAPSGEHAAAYALMNGSDLQVGGGPFNKLDLAIQQGLATEARLNEAVRRSFKVHFSFGRFDPLEATAWSRLDLESVNTTLHQQISYEAALQSLVLLKNDGALPLKVGVNVAVLGPQGVARKGLLSDYASDQICYQGTDECIGTIAEGVAAANTGGATVAAAGVDLNSNKTDGIKPALELAKNADVTVLALGIDKTVEKEGKDRTDTALPGLQERFAQQVLALGRPVVLVLVNGGALAIDSLVSRGSTSVPYAIVEAFNPAVMGGRALGASLFGHENRWGKLPITIYPHNYIYEQPMVNYDMSVKPGRTYKYYQGTPLFPFGLGLSLTSFELACSPPRPAPAWKSVSVNCTVKNTGGRAGDEVVQVYHRAADIGHVDHPLPKRALVDFSRATVLPGELGHVSFTLALDAFKVVDKEGERVLYPGRHEVIVSRGLPDDEQVFSIEVPTEALVIL